MTQHKGVPLKPSEVLMVRRDTILTEVIDVFNEFITQRFDGRQAVVQKDDVVDVLVNKGFDRQDIYTKHLLNVEDVFRQAGWVVTYTSPDRDESFNPYFTFKAPNGNR
jgi:hypothetical protein